MTISPINLGNSFTNGSGATVLGGLSSGLNTQSVINGIVAAQSAQITPLQDQITVNNKQLSALTTLQNLLNDLQTAAAPLANPQSPDPTNNLWAVNTSNVTSNTTQPASNYLTATVASGTAAGTYTISDITSIASATTQQSAAFTDANVPIVVASGASAGQFNAGTITIAGPSGSGSVTLTAGQTLSQVVNDFNVATGSTGLTAAVTEANGVYTLGFTNAGNPVSLNLTDGSYGLTADTSDVFSAQSGGTYTVAAASDAVVVASGATTGELNAGTFTLQGPAGSGTVTLTTGESLSAVAAAITASSAGVTATVTGTSGAYALAFTNTSTGDPITVSLTDPPALVTSDPSGVLNGQTTGAYTLNIADIPVVVASGATGNQFTAGTIDITGPGGSGVVTLKAGDTLGDVATDFNNESSETGISASVLQTSPGQYTLVFTSTTTGADTAFDLGSGSTVTGGTGTLSTAITSSGLTDNGVTDGTDANFELNGTAIDRPTNNITDLISGVTLNLLQNTNATPSASFTLQITPDTNSIEEGITGFATAYNNFLSFYAAQTQLNSSGTAASSAILYSDTTLRTIYDQVSDEASAIVQGLSSGALNTLAATGISFANVPATSTAPEVDNTLSVDSSALLSALQTNFSQVENVFGSNLTSSSSDVALYQSPTVAGVTSFTLNANQSDSTTPIVVASGAVPGQFNAGTITIDGPNGSGNVTFTAGQTLSQIVGDFNAASGSTGLTAADTYDSSTGLYTLSFTNTSTSASVPFDLTSSSDVTSDPSGVLAEQTNATYTLGAFSALYTNPSTNEQTLVNFTPTALGSGGFSLAVPADDGALSGLQLIYAGTAAASGITVNLSQGIADQINNAISSILTANTGLLAEDQTAIQAKTTSVNTQITNVTNQVTTTRQQLLTKFAALETAINAANSSLDLLNAEQLAGSSSGG